MLTVRGYRILSLLCESDQTRVYRAVRDGDQLPVVIKEYGGLEAGHRQARCEQELLMLGRLDSRRVARGVEVVGHGSSALLVLEEVTESESLAKRLEAGPMPAVAAIRVAVELVHALAHVHRRGLIHKDLKPSNVVVDEDLRRVVLIDFGTATDVAQEAEAPRPEGELAGSLHYLPPEQTGRTATPLDYRADYYALGCTLYHMLSGSPPFLDEQTFTGLLYAQLARSPSPLDAVANVPKPLAALVEKLTRKAAEQRYQGATGLLHDLQQCLNMIEEGRTNESFPLGTCDRPERLVLGVTLYGRQAQSERLSECVAGLTDETRHLVLVKGMSGSGKTALIQQQLAAIHLRGARYAAGKFDMLNCSAPYSAMLDILRHLLSSFASYSEADQVQIRERVQQTDYLPTAVYLLPELRGLDLNADASPTPPPAGKQGRLRCERVLAHLLFAFGLPGHPLVLVIDDMQWADYATIELLKRLLCQGDGWGLLIIASYRSDEVTPSHPWAMALQILEERCVPVTSIEVPLLTLSHTAELVRDCLHDPQGVQELAELTHHSTVGNPYFIGQYLQLAVQRGILRIDEDSGTWRWDMDDMRQLHSSDNVVHLLLERLHELSPEALALLMRAAAYADRFDLATLAVLEDKTPFQVAGALEGAVRAGLIRTDSRQLRECLEPNLGLTTARQVVFRFAHDRVRAALYGLLGERAPRAHAEIVERLWRPDAPLEFDRQMVDHGVRGRAFIRDPQLRLALASASHRVGTRALSMGMYAAAESTLGHVPQWLTSSQAVGPQRDLVFAASVLQVRAARLAGQWDHAWSLVRALKPVTDVERAEIDVETVYLATVSRTLEETLELALGCLARQGLALPRRASKAQVLAALAKIKLRLRVMGLERLRGLPPMQDPLVQQLQRLLGVSIGPVYQLGLQNLYSLMTVNLLQLSLDHGMSAEGLDGLALYAFLEMFVFRDYEFATRYSDVAIALIGSYDAPRINANIHCNRAFCIEHWLAESRAAVLNRLRDAYLISLHAGDDHTASATLSGVAYGSMLLGETLSDTATAARQLRAYYEQARDDVRLSAAQALIGLCEVLADTRRSDLQGPYEVDTQALPPLHAYYAHGHRLLSDLLWHRHDALAHEMSCLSATRAAGRGVVLDAVEPALVALAHWWLARRDPGHRRTARRQARRSRKRLARWSKGSPALADCPADLTRALLLHLNGDPHGALGALELSMASGRINKQPHFAGLAAEVAIELALDLGKMDRVLYYSGVAAGFYRVWGAEALVMRLGPRIQNVLRCSGHGELVSELLARIGGGAGDGETHSEFLTRTKRLAATGAISPSLWAGHGPARGDDDPLAPATLRLAELTEREEVLRAALSLLTREAGATAAMVFEVRNGSAELIALGSVRADDGASLEVQIDPSEGVYPRSVVARAIHTGCVALPNASAMGPHTSDPYFRRTGARSVLCLGVRRTEVARHVVYLENRDVPDMFRPLLAKSVSALAGPLSIALDNAALIGALEDSNRSLQAALDNATAADQAKTAFLENMSHELRTPLNGVMGNADLLAQSGLSEQQGQCLEHLRASAQTLLNRIANILDFAQLASGEATLYPADVELRTVLDGAVGRFRFEASTLGIDLRVDSNVDPGVFVHMDEGRLARLLDHLIDNSMKFSKGTKVTVVGRLDRSAGQLVLEVADDGVGIDARRLEDIFELFQQGDLSSTKRVAGIGLGLCTVKRLAVLMGGSVGVVSSPGDGARFSVVVPVRIVEATHVRDGPMHVQRGAGGEPNRLVLIVEDDRMNSMIAQRTVRKMGWDVVCCVDGIEAVATYAERGGELAFILMDCQMPNMDGYEATRRIRQREKECQLSHCPVIAVTANALEGDKKKCLDAGMDRFLAKPLRPAELSALIVESVGDTG